MSRPPTIAHLANIALSDLWDPSKELKYYLRQAEKLRREANAYLEPPSPPSSSHHEEPEPDYEKAFIKLARAATLVMERIPEHRDFEKVLSEVQRENLKLVSVFVCAVRRGRGADGMQNGLSMMTRMGEIKPLLMQRIVAWDQAHGVPQQQQQGQREAGREKERERENGEVRFNPSLQRRETRSMPPLPSLPQPSTTAAPPPETSLRKAAALAAAQRAAAAGEEERARRQRAELDMERERVIRAQEEERARAQRQQDEMRLREEEIRRKKEAERREVEERERQIGARQREADEKARSVRRTIAVNNPGVVQTQPGFDENGGPRRLPLEAPGWGDGDTTDEERKGRRIEYPVPVRSGSMNYPPPITTASLPQLQIQYPQLMSSHQKGQGYRPSAAPPPLPISNTPSPVHGAPPYPIPVPHPYQPPPPQQQLDRHPSVNYPGPSRPPPPLPMPPAQQHHPPQQAPPPQRRDTTTTNAQKPKRTDGLRPVSLPRECLPRFLGIALPNTSRNLETCGLLLGRAKGGDSGKGERYVVTTLLVPKQHATADTCAMEGEELVLRFTEERGLITLGWIHTHPSQSCFMSSVDLHTHAGFQCMLRESFAVVCAPKSEPNFGIFRLTDPPGLETVLRCEAKEAFHPHPDRPIYTSPLSRN
ncbi:hypothetical protein DXG01_014323 [Tephrocybe rancida]|nr:hypothetical protein DXG01_014323 [Tephrocybe rancida]